MADKDFRKLKRWELIEIIEELQKDSQENTEDKKENEENKDKKIELDAALQSIQAEQNRREKKQHLFSAIGILLVVAAISVLIATRLVPVLQVSGKSMEPALENGELVVIKKTTKIKQGDIIGFYYQSKILVKRVIGTAGDYIDIDEDGNVYVNGEKLDEPYAIKKDLGECDIDFPYQVPEGKYFVMGDHRSVSVDSRSSAIGCVAEDQIIGKVAFRFWPLSKMGFLK
ncbi:MAG: signal peptidase I [Lachnospiraceae bacterium]|nr:signal peptidase I [Lachnospiraceae bacterium]